ncbi:MAG: heme-binding domain-containing protein [Acidimicrobiia bacterium]
MAVRACFDCHSNETEWPWYTNIAPISWLIQSDVDEGREELNFSEWDREQEGEEAAETVREGSMPPNAYLLTHPTARLTEAELAELIDGLLEMFGDGEEGDDD